jgi:neutral trehalase
MPAGSDLEEYIPQDWCQDPAFISGLPSVPSHYTKWARDLNALWLVLGRQVSADVLVSPQRHSYLPRKGPIVVPGGRFRESYYWDSLWIIQGLLVCDMRDTATDVVSTLLDDVELLGFVPNGGRIYYLDRSQPPMLSEMVADPSIYRLTDLHEHSYHADLCLLLSLLPIFLYLYALTLISISFPPSLFRGACIQFRWWR